MNPKQPASTPAEFHFSDWLDSTHGFPVIFAGKALPPPPDQYRPGHLTWGSNPKRGRAIQRSRGCKARRTNEDFFREAVLPRIRDDLDFQSRSELCRYFPDLYPAFGFVRYALRDRAAWIHPTEEPNKIAQAVAMGATPSSPQPVTQ